MGFLDNIRAGKSNRGSNPDRTKYWGTLSPAAVECFKAGKGKEAETLKKLRAEGKNGMARVLTYHSPEDIPASGKAQYSQFALDHAESWSEMIVGEAIEAAGRSEEAKFLPYDTIGKHNSFRPIADGMNSEEAFGDAFRDGLALALKAEPEAVKALLEAHDRI